MSKDKFELTTRTVYTCNGKRFHFGARVGSHMYMTFVEGKSAARVDFNDDRGQASVFDMMGKRITLFRYDYDWKLSEAELERMREKTVISFCKYIDGALIRP